MAFFQEARPKREPAFNAPVSLLALIAVLVAAHVARVASPDAVSNWVIDTFALDPAVYSPAWLSAHHLATPTLFARAVPLVGHMFIHGSYFHLGVNCLWLLAFGAVVARRFGAGLFYLFFLVCGVVGAAVFVALEWGQAVGAIGASGAISGITAAAIRMLRRPEASGDWRPAPLLPLFSRQVLVFTFVWMVANIVTGITGLGAGPGIEAIAWQAHLGGYLAGLFLVGPFDRLHARLYPDRQPAA